MTDAQSRTHRPRFIEHYSYTQVRVTFSSCSEASSFCKAINGGNFTIDPVVQAALSYPAPQRDEHITRMLDQLSSGVGTFLQADGVGLSEYVRGLEAQVELLGKRNQVLVRLDESNKEHVGRAIERVDELTAELADLKRQLAEKDAEIKKQQYEIDALYREKGV